MIVEAARRSRKGDFAAEDIVLHPTPPGSAPLHRPAGLPPAALRQNLQPAVAALEFAVGLHSAVGRGNEVRRQTVGKKRAHLVAKLLIRIAKGKVHGLSRKAKGVPGWARPNSRNNIPIVPNPINRPTMWLHVSKCNVAAIGQPASAASRDRPPRSGGLRDTRTDQRYLH